MEPGSSDPNCPPLYSGNFVYVFETLDIYSDFFIFCCQLYLHNLPSENANEGKYGL
jgi:hypothetical protein